MIDGHVSLSTPYTLENLMNYIQEAYKKGLDGIIVIEPTYKFKECAVLYHEVCTTHPYQKEWYASVCHSSIQEYQNFITEMRKYDFPIDVKFGLEVCYFTQHEDFISQIKQAFPYDVFIGTIQFVDNVAFSWPKHSFEMLWDKYNAVFLYRRYYEMMNAMLTSHLFDGVSKFDGIKTLKVPCRMRLNHTYKKMATLLSQEKMYVENDMSLDYRFHHRDKGLDPAFIAIAEQHDIKIIPCSLAERPSFTGRGIR